MLLVKLHSRVEQDYDQIKDYFVYQTRLMAAAKTGLKGQQWESILYSQNNFTGFFAHFLILQECQEQIIQFHAGMISSTAD